MTRLAGRCVVVTGGGSGIGAAGAKAFAAEGAAVHVADIDPGRAEAVVEELLASGADATAHTVDVTDADAVEQLAADVYAHSGRVDVVWSNAGIGMSGPAVEITPAQWRRVVDVNLMGVVHGVCAFAPRLVAQGGPAHILHTASGLGLVPTPNVGPYTATKAAVVALSEGLAAELAPNGIAVTALCPGVIDTAIIEATEFTESARTERGRTEWLFDRGAAPEKVATAAVRAVLDGPVGGRRGFLGSILPTQVVKVVPWSHVALPWMLQRLAPGVPAQLAARLSAGRGPLGVASGDRARPDPAP